MADRPCSADLAEASAVVQELVGCIAAEFDLEQAGEHVEEAEEGSAEKTRIDARKGCWSRSDTRCVLTKHWQSCLQSVHYDVCLGLDIWILTDFRHLGACIWTLRWGLEVQMLLVLGNMIPDHFLQAT